MKIVHVLFGVFVVFFVLCLGAVIPPVGIFVYMFFGWVPFLVRTLPEVRLNIPNSLTAATCVVLLIVVLHWFCSWLRSSRKENGRWKFRWSLAIVAVVLLMFMSGIAVVGMTHQAAWLARSPDPLWLPGGIRQAAARTMSLNNLKQIGLAMHNLADVDDRWPPGATFDSRGRAMHSWQTLLLPYLDQDTLFRQIDQTLAWDDPIHQSAFSRVLNLYQYGRASTLPEKDASGYAFSQYAANVRVMGGDRRWTLQQLRERGGLSNILVAGEVADNFMPWGQPGNWRDPALGIKRNPKGFGSAAWKGAQFLLADGSVRFFADDADPEFLRAMANPDDEP